MKQRKMYNAVLYVDLTKFYYCFTCELIESSYQTLSQLQPLYEYSILH